MGALNRRTRVVSGYTVDCSANRGRTYRVAFSEKGEVQTVRVKVYTSNVHYHWRMIWNLSYGEMTTTAACAVRSAIEKRKQQWKPCSRGNDTCPIDCCTTPTR